MRIFVASFLVFLTVFGSASADIRTPLKAIFAQDMATLDLARTKVEIDKLIEPSINVEQQLAEIEQMVAAIKTMLPENANSGQKAEALRRYIYEPSRFNDGKVFSYDLNDPYGDDPSNKLLSNYIADRQGNCITMPFLFIILGQRLGLDVKPALAPLHVFVKFVNDDGREYNLETTSGAGITRDQHYRDILPITDTAIASGIYLKSLTKRETVAVMASVLVESLIQQKRYTEAIAAADLLLKEYPKFAYLMVKKGTAAYYLLKQKFHSKYKTAAEIPASKHDYFRYLQQVNKTSFDRADELGWQQVKR